jgi:phage shock protein A
MSTTAEPMPALSGTADEFASLSDTLRRLQARFTSQQTVVADQQAEIDRLSAKIEHLRDQLDKFYEHHGMVARPITAEEIAEMDADGLTLGDFLAELDRIVGK